MRWNPLANLPQNITQLIEQGWQVEYGVALFTIFRDGKTNIEYITTAEDTVAIAQNLRKLINDDKSEAFRQLKGSHTRGQYINITPTLVSPFKQSVVVDPDGAEELYYRKFYFDNAKTQIDLHQVLREQGFVAADGSFIVEDET